MLEINPAGKAENGALRYSGKISIVEKVSEKHFRVKVGSLVGGQEFIVSSKNNLSPGDMVKGTIFSKGNSLILTIFKNSQKNPVFFDPADKNNHILEKNNIILRFLTSFLDSTGKKADNTLLSILESLILKKKIADNFSATLAGEAYLKGFKNESAISVFLSAITPDQEKNQDNQKQRKKKKKEEIDEIKEVLSKAVSVSDQEENPVFIFNHLPLLDKNWMIVPFQIDDLKGDLRLNASENQLKNLIIHAEKGTFKWFFELFDFKSPQKMVKIYTNKEGTLACQGKKFDLFKKKLQNLGVKIDDNIYDIHIFNGFSRVNASYDVDLRI